MNSSKVVLVVAPHADDETLGCGGTLLRYAELGAEIHWLLVTEMSTRYGYKEPQVLKRNEEIERVAKAYRFSQVHKLGLQPAALDTISKSELVGAISKVINRVKPDDVFTVFRNDAHSDHEIVYDAVISATKSFRCPFIKRVFAYETISETDFCMKPGDGGFKPNVFVNISGFLEKKLNILDLFESEVGEFPFPRSRVALEALARLRGVQCNSDAAEAFVLLKEIV
ncbi:PIG-L deacetylase family protein [Shewanella litorisediminis]|uniref:PIG-L family deacetylase n=1 Tax=Shewanella litorisediminis TaxID=1173586 RepID=A0ABX7FZZ3_9GAMM|nr:PIG-L family deacetylase [Shewanella litorisediminis]MCL2918344.1 PIG-L family deacetylase [Shewanella litorisediminis]QRH00609.1 PIG-L family deacetylase [Shewanella litorisediminis]